MFERARCSQLCVAALLLAAATASAQSTGAHLTISAAKTGFNLGEVIPLELKFTATEPNRFLADSRQYDRVGRMNYTEEFVVEPSGLAEDPLAGLPGGEGGMGGLSGGPMLLSDKPFAFERVLNDYVRFRRPGEFRVHVVSRRVSEVDDPRQLEESRRFYARGKPVELISNVLILTIRPAPAAWVAEQIAAARASLDEPSTPTDQSARERQNAIRVLRFLDSPEAARELARRLPPGNDMNAFEANVGVLASPYRKELLPILQERLVAPDQPVSERYLETLAQLAEILALDGPMTPYPKDPARQKEWQAESKRRSDLRQQKRDEYVARVVASLPAKQPDARATSLSALLNVGMRSSPPPPWVRNVVAGLIGDFRNLPAATQRELLEYQWDALKAAPILPALRDLIGNRDIQGVALRRLFELAPEEGRKIILDEIRQPTKNLDFATLAMLPDASLPELDDVLAQRFDPQLILRYATGDVVKRVEETYLARPEERFCSGPLAFYFLKYDPPFGEKLLRADFARPNSPPVCYDIGLQLQTLGRWAYSPALERIAVGSLMSDKVPVKRGAAEVLGRYGSAAAQKPLWEAMEYFRSWWKDREEELTEKVGDEGRQLEVTLRISLARADGWVFTEPELRRLLDLCSSQWCRNDVNGWLGAAKSPVSIQILPQSGGVVYNVGQYGSGDSAWLARKLAQYPDATTFQLAGWLGAPDARQRAEDAVRTAGHTLAPKFLPSVGDGTLPAKPK